MAFRSLEAWMERQDAALTNLQEQQTRMCRQLDIWMEENSKATWMRDEHTTTSRVATPCWAESTWATSTVPWTPRQVRNSRSSAQRASKSLAAKPVGRDSKRESLTKVSIIAQRDLELAQREEALDVYRRFSNLISSTRFETIFAGVVLSNFLWIGVQMEYKQKFGNQGDSLCLIVDTVFCIAFLLELVLRVFGIGIAEFFCSETDWAWNWFDVVIVSLTIFETALTLVYGYVAGGLEGVSSLRVVRVMRVLRVVRVIRGMRNFRPLRLLIHAIANTLRSAIWTLLLLMMIIYTFSVMFAQSTREFLDEREPDLAVDDVLRNNYGTLGTTLYTLFSASTGGCDWQEVAAPLQRVHWACLAGFVIYISFQYFCVMNVVTGIFCQSALEIAKNDREDMIAQQLLDKEKYVTALQDLFKEWDRAGTGEISLEEFQHHMKDSRMQAFLRTLEIEPNNAYTLFKLLDADGQGTLDVSEFVGGLIELRGNAKSIQIHELLHESSLARENLQRMFDYLVAVENEKIARVVRDQYDAHSGTGSTTDTLSTPPSGGGTPPSRRESFSAVQNPTMPSAPPTTAFAVPPPEPPHVVAIDEV